MSEQSRNSAPRRAQAPVDPVQERAALRRSMLVGLALWLVFSLLMFSPGFNEALPRTIAMLFGYVVACPVFFLFYVSACAKAGIRRTKRLKPGFFIGLAVMLAVVALEYFIF